MRPWKWWLIALIVTLPAAWFIARRAEISSATISPEFNKSARLRFEELQSCERMSIDKEQDFQACATDAEKTMKVLLPESNSRAEERLRKKLGVYLSHLEFCKQWQAKSAFGRQEDCEAAAANRQELSEWFNRNKN